MILSLATDLDEILSDRNWLNLGKVAPSPALAAYAADQAVSEARRSLDLSKQSSPSSAALYMDQRIEPIGRADHWTALLLRVRALTVAISSAAAPSVVHVLGAPATLSLHRYVIRGFPEPGDIPGLDLSIELLDVLEIEQGDWFVIPPGPIATVLAGPVEQSYFLRFVAPDEVPLTFSFNQDDHRLRAVAFADQRRSGRHFFASLLQNVTRPGANGIDFDAEDRDAIGRFVTRQLDEESTHLVTKWKLVQTGARIAPAAARDWLRRVAETGPATAASHARQALSRVGG
jgi:hypothetical protein